MARWLLARAPGRLWPGFRNEAGRDLGDEPVTGFGNGLDVAAVAISVAEDLTENGDPAAEVALLDERVRPHGSNQLVASHEMARVLDQDLQDGKDLRRERDDASVLLELLLRRNQAIRAECVDARAFLV